VTVLLSGSGGSVELRPLRYQFVGARGEWFDDNWLVIGGEIATASGAWSFADPALLTDECAQVSAWLRAVAGGTVPATARDTEGLLAPGLSFLEPVVAFSVAGYRDDAWSLRVHLSLEAAPSWWRDAGGDLFQYVVEVQADEAALVSAADQWDAQLAQFPPR
jgi:hypothetical protein